MSQCRSHTTLTCPSSRGKFKLLSRWAERGRYASATSAVSGTQVSPQHASGFRVVLKKRAETVTTEHVRRLMDEEGA